MRIEKTKTRRGDNAQLARVSFVDDLHGAPVAVKAASRTAASDTKTVSSAAKPSKPASKPRAAMAKVAIKPAVAVKAKAAKEIK